MKLEDFNKKLLESLDKYSKTTEDLINYNKKIISKQYDALIDVVKTLNSINVTEAKKEATAKPTATATKAEPVKTAPAAKPTVKASIIKAAATPAKATTKPAVKAEIVDAVKKAPAKKATVAAKPATKESKAPAKAKPVAKKATPAKPANKKVSAKDKRLADLKAATKQAVKKTK